MPTGERQAKAPVAPAAHSPGREATDRPRKLQVLTQHTASGVRSISDAVVIKDGEPFFLCPPDGQIPIHEGHGFGLYQHDTRYLAGYELTVAGATPSSLAATALSGAHAALELTMPALNLPGGGSIAKDRLAVRWTRELDGDEATLRDTITLRNYDTTAVRVPLRFRFTADFNDVFAVRGLLSERPGRLRPAHWDGDALVFRYDGKDGVIRRLTITVGATITSREETSCEVALHVPDRGSASVRLSLVIGEEVQAGAAPIERRTRPHSSAERRARQPRAGASTWPVSVSTDGITLNAALSRSLDDLLMLRGELDGRRYYAAGIPWFSTLFGRDALISAYQTLAYDPRVAEDTLRLLAGRQGSQVDEFRDEQPGKILHELRIGELARLNEIPQTPYYGSIDATPLFLILLARHAAWTGRLDLFRELRPHVERALAWLATDADPHHAGWIAYDSPTDHGLVNQGWKDSGDGITTGSGGIPTPPIALAEVQGYAFLAWRELADLFERSGDWDRAVVLRRAAEDLRERFERSYWSDAQGCYALALDGNGRRCDVVTSNAGQVLWSGIAAPERAEAVARRLLDDDLFNGWGIRTLSSRAKAYNPIGYHLGTVWPHDNGLVAEGFRRYGLDHEAERVFGSLLEASADFPQQRLPECFAGFARADFGVPVRYPIACHPQAWAAGAIPHLLVVSLGLTPCGFERTLRIVRPRLPGSVHRVELRGLQVAEASVDLTFERTDGGTTVSVRRIDGDLDVRVE